VKQADFIWFDSSRAGYHRVLRFRLSVRYRLVAVWRAGEAFALILHLMILLHWKTAQVLDRLSLQ
jgi:hypothetical protein